MHLRQSYHSDEKNWISASKKKVHNKQYVENFKKITAMNLRKKL